MPSLLRRKAVVLPLSVLVVAVAAFEGYGAYTRSKPVDYSRGGRSFAAPAATPSSTPTPGVTATTAASITPTAAPIASPAATQIPASLPRTDATAEPSAAASAPTVIATKAGLAVPRTGTYQLAVSGSEKVKFGVVSFCHQSLPARTSLVVSKAAGESPTSYDFDLRYFPGKTGQHDERHIYRYTPTTTYLDYEIATVTCQGVRQSSTVNYGPPEVRAQLPLAVGKSWKVHSGDAARTETGTGKVLRTENVKVGSQVVPTWVIQVSTDLTGDEHGNRTQTWWYSPSWAMPVKWSEQINGSRSGAAYSEDVTVNVLSRP